MKREPLSRHFVVALTDSDKEMLAALAEHRGGTMRGTIRKLIRDAAHNSLGEPGQQETRYAASPASR
jgi:hypothetical protein